MDVCKLYLRNTTAPHAAVITISKLPPQILYIKRVELAAALFCVLH